MTNEELIKRVKANPKFDALVAKKTSFGILLSIVMLAIYYGFILVIAFSPKVLATPLGAGVTTVGMPIGVAVILSAFALTGVYVARANSEFDSANQEIIEEAKNGK